MSTKRALAQTFAPLVDLIYPPRCSSCGAGIGEHGGLCEVCWADLVIPVSPCCCACQRPFGPDGPQDGMLCGPCLQAPPKHDGIAAATLYSDVSRKLILSLKHGGKIALAPMLAKLMAARLPKKDGQIWLVPVPLHRGRLWHRGYNQAALLAGELAKLGCGELMVDALARTKPTPSLAGLGARARRSALKGAIQVRPGVGHVIRGSRVILVDDVYTSGATSAACVSTLKHAGVQSVVISCFARVLDEAVDPSKRNARGLADPGAT